MRAGPVPRGLMTRRQGGTMRSRMAALVRVPRTLPRVLSPEQADRLVGALRTHRDRAMAVLTHSWGCRLSGRSGKDRSLWLLALLAGTACPDDGIGWQKGVRR